MTGCRVMGVDISEDKVLRAREKLKTIDSGIQFVLGDQKILNFLLIPLMWFYQNL